MRQYLEQTSFYRKTSSQLVASGALKSGPATISSVYFLNNIRIADGGPRYEPSIVSLGEGLHQLGVLCFAAAPFYPLSRERQQHLLEVDPAVHPLDCDVIVVDHSWFLGDGDVGFGPTGGNEGVGLRVAQLEALVAQRGRRARVVLVDPCDAPFEIWQPWFPRFDKIFRAHLNRYGFKSPNMVPSAFSFTNRMIAALKPEMPWDQRAPVVLNTFRILHSVRSKALDVLDKVLSPELGRRVWNDNFAVPADAEAQFLHEVTGQRHNLAYYAAIGGVQTVAAFGGSEFEAAPDWVRAVGGRFDAGRAHRMWAAIGRRARIGGYTPWRSRTAVSQFDSWRFWETLGSGTVAFHVDLDLYGAMLPVQPVNGTHYVGLDLSSEESVREGIEAARPHFPAVAEAGRAWALEHYSPVAIARHFLSELA